MQNIEGSFSVAYSKRALCDVILIYYRFMPFREYMANMKPDDIFNKDYGLKYQT